MVVVDVVVVVRLDSVTVATSGTTGASVGRFSFRDFSLICFSDMILCKNPFLWDHFGRSYSYYDKY